MLTARPAFLIPSRLLFLATGGLGLILGLAHLVDEVQRKEVDTTFTVGAGAVALLWLLSLVLAWRGRRMFLLVGGLIAFVELGRQISTHFVAGTAELTALAKSRGIWAVLVLLVLAVACVISCLAALEAASQPVGRIRSPRYLPLLVTSVAGALLILADAARLLAVVGSFGAMGREDAALLAVVAAATWVMGALWMPSHPIRGVVLVGVTTAVILVSFYGLHLAAKAPAPLQKSGPDWGAAAIAMAALALASLLLCLLPPALRYLTGDRGPLAAARRAAVRRAGTRG